MAAEAVPGRGDRVVADELRRDAPGGLAGDLALDEHDLEPLAVDPGRQPAVMGDGGVGGGGGEGGQQGDQGEPYTHAVTLRARRAGDNRRATLKIHGVVRFTPEGGADEHRVCHGRG
jgi:hypothetical protein